LGDETSRDRLRPRQRLEHNARTPNPYLPGWLIGGDGQGGDGRITFAFGNLPVIGPIVFEQGWGYSMNDVAAAINAASQACLRYDAAQVVHDPDSDDYFLRVEARKAELAPWDPSRPNRPTQQGMTETQWAETCGVSGHFPWGWYDLGGDLEVDRLHMQGGILDSYSWPVTVTVTGELSFSCDSYLVPDGAMEFRMAGADLTNAALELKSAWSRVTMRFLPSERTARLEVDAIDVGPDPAVWEPIAPKSMVLGALHVGSVVELVDEFGNQLHGGVEALYVHDLVMEPGGRIRGGLNLYYLNGGDPKQFFAGDANLDGEVGIADLVALADAYGLGAGVAWRRGDFDGDGVVGIVDLAILADNYGSVTQPVGGARVPEPATCAALAGGWIALLLARRRRRRV
jgi:hypothetical protein